MPFNTELTRALGIRGKQHSNDEKLDTDDNSARRPRWHAMGGLR
jgi:hypothetical protein